MSFFRLGVIFFFVVVVVVRVYGVVVVFLLFVGARILFRLGCVYTFFAGWRSGGYGVVLIVRRAVFF